MKARYLNMVLIIQYVGIIHSYSYNYLFKKKNALHFIAMFILYYELLV